MSGLNVLSTPQSFYGPADYLLNRRWSFQLIPYAQTGVDQFGNPNWAPSSQGLLYQQDAQGRNLRIVFNVEKVSEGQSGKGKVEIWNLNSTSRLLFQKGAQVIVQAGYNSPNLFKTIITGDVLPNGVKIERHGQDIATVFEVGISERFISYNIHSATYPPGTMFSTILKDVAKTLGVEISTVGSYTDFAYNRSVLINHTCKDALDMLTRTNDLEWSVQDEGLIIKAKSAPSDNQAITLSSGLDKNGYIIPNTGLIGIPTYNQGGISFVNSLLNPDLGPGRLINVISKNMNGLFMIRRSDMKGDSHGHDWHIEHQVVEAPDYQVVSAPNSAGSF